MTPQSKSLKQLAKEQGVRPCKDMSNLRGPPELAGMLAAQERDKALQRLKAEMYEAAYRWAETSVAMSKVRGVSTHAAMHCDERAEAKYINVRDEYLRAKKAAKEAKRRRQPDGVVGRDDAR